MTLTGHPGLFFVVFWPIVAAFVSYLTGKYNKDARDAFANFATILTFSVMALLVLVASNDNPPVFQWSGFMGFRIFLQLDGFRCVYGIITAFMWMITTLYSKEYFAHYRNRNRYYFFLLLTFGATMGVFLSADLITTFIFFEVMSMTSYVMVLHDEKPGALEASRTYMAVAIIGGLAMLFGIFIISHELGTTEIGKLYYAMKNFEGDKAQIYLAAAFMLVGFGGKAGMYPIHIWLPNAHPVAPAPASALLSGVLTKTGIFGIIVMSVLLFYNDAYWGMAMLIIGIVGMFTGALLALFSIDLKRTLACSSVSQIGFIILGIGMQLILRANMADYDTTKYSIMPIQGTILHMVNHSLIKLVLFVMAGVVYLNVHELDLNKVRGFGRGKPLFTFAFLMGVMGIIGIPFWNGYISKTLLHESLVYHIHYFYNYTPTARFFQIMESIFTFTGGLTTAYMIKIFVCVCVERNRFNQEKLSGFNSNYITLTGGAALFFSAMLLPILGFSPYTFMIPIANFAKSFMMASYDYKVDFFAWVNVKGAVASLAIGITLYFFVVRGCLMSKDAEGRSIYINVWPKVLDIEKRIYRPLLFRVIPFVGALFARTVASILPFIASLGYSAFMNIRANWEKISEVEVPVQKVSQGKPHIVTLKMPRNFLNMDKPRSLLDKLRTNPIWSNENIAKGFQNISSYMSNLYQTYGQQIRERFRNDVTQAIFSSLAYSMLVFLLGFAAVLFLR